MIKKISDNDKEAWENFLKSKEKTSNKNLDKKIKNKKTLEILNKNKQDWEIFLKSKERIPNKDFVNKKNIRNEKIISGDAKKIKTVYDTWIFSKDIKSSNPNWLLIDTIT